MDKFNRSRLLGSAIGKMATESHLRKKLPAVLETVDAGWEADERVAFWAGIVTASGLADLVCVGKRQTSVQKARLRRTGVIAPRAYFYEVCLFAVDK